MKAPLSWLKEYVEITEKTRELADRLTEVGLGVEGIENVGNDVIFDLEVTPNRPDWLSIIGIAREIAALENKKIKLPKAEVTTPKKATLPIKLKPDYTLFYRWTGMTIANVTIKPSPEWMQEKLKKVGLRPINNIVDITNYVMFELGIPLHAFDYDQIKGQTMVVEEAQGGEKFTSVDDKTYSLPKEAIIIRDTERIIDLAGIKGGLNSGITNKTKNVFLHITIDDPVHIRRTSQALALRSEASAIYERGPDKGGAIFSLKRAGSLIVELAGGTLASDIIDLKKEPFEPWKITLTHQHLIKVLGIDLDPKKVKSLLNRLGLSSIVSHERSATTYKVTIPTYRNDIKIPEDLIEEVARLYGYNNFPKTLPSDPIPTQTIPYSKDYTLDEKVKNMLKAAGFSEIYSYSLVNEKDLAENNIDPDNALRVDNPISREYEYLRTTLAINLRKALQENLPIEKNISLFELGKVHTGKNIEEPKEQLMLSGITNEKNYFEVKGMIERLFYDLSIDEDASAYISFVKEGTFFEIPYELIIKSTSVEKVFIPLPKYPPIIEDLALIADEAIKTGDIIKEIKKQNAVITEVSLLDQYKNTRTFHIVYQHKEKNLTNEEVGEIRIKILKILKEKFRAKLKE